MYGLAPSGVLQAKAAGTTLAKELEGLSISPDCVSIYTSPFSRTTQTAQAVADVLESSLGTKPSIQVQIEHSTSVCFVFSQICGILVRCRRIPVWFSHVQPLTPFCRTFVIISILCSATVDGRAKRAILWTFS
jgi:hypothetical protein